MKPGTVSYGNSAGFKPNVFTVSQVNGYVRGMLDDDVVLQGLFVEGELSNVTIHSSGHVYFTLKDDKAAINAVMFRDYAAELAFEPAGGMRVVAFGAVSLYEKSGQYQFKAEYMEPAGAGALFVAFEQLKAKLAREGLFDAARKKPIPAHPSRVAVITSPTGAAIRDIITVAGRRDKGAALVVVPVLVQGEGAARSVADGIRLVNEWGEADVIIVGRGGGSIEDLWAFNEEIVARAICASNIPVISAVGHETDFTIADFAADLRAPTPSAAAELAVFNSEEARIRLNRLSDALVKAMNRTLERNRGLVSAVIAAGARLPEAVTKGGARLAEAVRRLDRAMSVKLAQGEQGLNAKRDLLVNLSPEAALRRGYAIVFDERGKPLRHAANTADGETLRLRFSDGFVTSVVSSVELEEGGNGGEETHV